MWELGVMWTWQEIQTQVHCLVSWLLPRLPLSHPRLSIALRVLAGFSPHPVSFASDYGAAVLVEWAMQSKITKYCIFVPESVRVSSAKLSFGISPCWTSTTASLQRGKIGLLYMAVCQVSRATAATWVLSDSAELTGPSAELAAMLHDETKS